jgi:hypothetical protein
VRPLDPLRPLVPKARPARDGTARADRAVRASGPVRKTRAVPPAGAGRDGSSPWPGDPGPVAVRACGPVLLPAVAFRAGITAGGAGWVAEDGQEARAAFGKIVQSQKR